MTLVVDASALLASVLQQDAGGQWAESVIAGEQLVAPALLPAECGNILRRMEIAGEITSAEAATAYGDVLDAGVELHAFALFAERVWQLRHNVTSYDAWYVALAEWLGCPVVTVDRRLGRASGPRGEVLTPPGS